MARFCICGEVMTEAPIVEFEMRVQKNPQHSKPGKPFAADDLMRTMIMAGWPEGHSSEGGSNGQQEPIT